MHELSQLLKAKQKKKMRIPVPPETPELGGGSFASPLRLPRNSCFDLAQGQDCCRNQGLHTEQCQWVRKVFREHRDYCAGYCQIRERYPFECSTRRPSRRRFP